MWQFSFIITPLRYDVYSMISDHYWFSKNPTVQIASYRPVNQTGAVLIFLLSEKGKCKFHLLKYVGHRHNFENRDSDREKVNVLSTFVMFRHFHDNKFKNVFTVLSMYNGSFDLLFCICEFTYLLTFICNCQINTYRALWSFWDLHRAARTLSHLVYTVSGQVKQDNTPPPCSALTLSTSVLFTVYLMLHFCIFMLLIAVLLFKMSPSRALTCCLMSLRAKRLWCASRRKHLC